MADAFHSERLTYRAIEDNDEDIAFIHSLRLDSQSRANGDSSLFKPVNKANSANSLTRYRDEDFLGVIICLPGQHAESEEKTTEPIMKSIGRISLKVGKRTEEHHRTANMGSTLRPSTSERDMAVKQSSGYLNGLLSTEACTMLGFNAFHTIREHDDCMRAWDSYSRARTGRHCGITEGGMTCLLCRCLRMNGARKYSRKRSREKEI